MRRVASVAVAVVVAAWSGPAAAEVERLVLIDVPANLEAALRTALEPWQVEIEVVGPPTPGPSMPSSATRAAEVATQRGAGAAVWIADDPSGSALWIYDAESQRTTARSLAAPPPFDDAAAAAAALTVKTLLRFSAIAPRGERYGAPIAPAPSAAAAVRFAVTARAGLRRRVTGDGDFEPRFGIGGLARVALGPPLALELATELRLGPGEAVDTATFVGHYSDAAIAARAGLEIALGPRLALRPALGGSLHFTAIDGSLPAQGRSATARRANPTVDGAVRLSADVGRGLTVGLELEASYALQRQRYLVAGAPVFTVPAIESELSVWLAVPLP